MIKHSSQSGFTAVELLITLFVAAAFLTSGYQLYNLSIKDSGQARAELKAGNTAYDYMRRYTTTPVFPCVGSTPLTNSAITVSGLSSVQVSVAITCPYAAVTSVSRITVTVTYNNPQQTVKFATYVTK